MGIKNDEQVVSVVLKKHVVQQLKDRASNEYGSAGISAVIRKAVTLHLEATG